MNSWVLYAMFPVPTSKLGVSEEETLVSDLELEVLFLACFSPRFLSFRSAFELPSYDDSKKIEVPVVLGSLNIGLERNLFWNKEVKFWWSLLYLLWLYGHAKSSQVMSHFGLYWNWKNMILSSHAQESDGWHRRISIVNVKNYKDLNLPYS